MLEHSLHPQKGSDSLSVQNCTGVLNRRAISPPGHLSYITLLFHSERFDFNHRSALRHPCRRLCRHCPDTAAPHAPSASGEKHTSDRRQMNQHTRCPQGKGRDAGRCVCHRRGSRQPRTTPRPVTLTFLEAWDQFVNNVLHGPVVTDVLQRVALVDDNPACGTRVVLLQILHQAAPADCVKAHSRQKASAQWRCHLRPHSAHATAGSTTTRGAAVSTACQVPTGQASHCPACCLTQQAGGLGTRGTRECQDQEPAVQSRDPLQGPTVKILLS